MIYSKQLKELREKNNLTQNDLAKALLVSRTAYTQYESEYVIIPTKHLNTLCNYYNVSLDYIFSFTDDLNYVSLKKEIDKEVSARRLKEFRKENKLTQVKLAEILKISDGTLAGYEIGRYIIATPFLYTICSKYHISADYLLGKIDNPKYLK
ncbi:MAG: helix-turn-helix domain-containing protein, partial [Ruminococcus sp.]|nr:helix-turn-helix domain-containing protein [Ruminococcus sp.]